MLRGGGAKGHFALPDVSHLSLGHEQKPKQHGLGMPAHVILHHIHVKCLWPQSWALQISIWDKWTWVHQEPDWLRPVHKANPGLLSGTADDHRAFCEEIDHKLTIIDLNLEMSVTQVSSFHRWSNKGGKRSEMSKREKRPKKSNN